MKIFAGYCKGGPLDKQSLVHDDPFYRVPMREPLSWRMPTDDEVINPPDIKACTYKYDHDKQIWWAMA